MKNQHTKKEIHVLVLGKFMPPHKGHEALINFAKETLKQKLKEENEKFNLLNRHREKQIIKGKVHVLVDCLDGQTLLPHVRANMLKNDITDIEVHYLTKKMPQFPEMEYDYSKYGYNDFWDMWKNEIVLHIGCVPNIVVASENYGEKLAKIFERFEFKDSNDSVIKNNCDFVLFDTGRLSIDISATKIRNFLQNNYSETGENLFQYLLPSAKAYFAKRICFLGPESSGKTTLAKEFSSVLNTQYVPEYAENYIKQKGFFDASDGLVFIKNQINMENVLAKNANQYLFCDSCYLSTKVFFQKMQEELIKSYQIKKQEIDKKKLNKEKTTKEENELENILKEIEKYSKANIDIEQEIEKLKYVNDLPHYDLFILTKPNKEVEFKNDEHRGQMESNFEERQKVFEMFVNELEKIKAKYVVLDPFNHYLVKNEQSLKHFLNQNLFDNNENSIEELGDLKMIKKQECVKEKNYTNN